MAKTDTDKRFRMHIQMNLQAEEQTTKRMGCEWTRDEMRKRKENKTD